MLRQLIKRLTKKISNYIPVKPTYANIISVSDSELLKGRTALITGGTGGIGYAIADAFLASGANVIISGRKKEILEECLEKLKIKHTNRAKVQYVIMDNLDISSFEKVMEQSNMQNIDILVNNAGVAGGHFIYNCRRVW